MLLWCSINRQSFFNDKSSFVSQIMICKSRNLQKLLTYLSAIATSTFKVVTADWFASPLFPDLSVVFATISVLYLNDLPSEALSLI